MPIFFKITKYSGFYKENYLYIVEQKISPSPPTKAPQMRCFFRWRERFDSSDGVPGKRGRKIDCSRCERKGDFSSGSLPVSATERRVRKARTARGNGATERLAFLENLSFSAIQVHNRNVVDLLFILIDYCIKKEKARLDGKLSLFIVL